MVRPPRSTSSRSKTQLPAGSRPGYRGPYEKIPITLLVAQGATPCGKECSFCFITSKPIVMGLLSHRKLLGHQCADIRRGSLAHHKWKTHRIIPSQSVEIRSDTSKTPSCEAASREHCVHATRVYVFPLSASHSRGPRLRPTFKKLA